MRKITIIFPALIIFKSLDTNILNFVYYKQTRMPFSEKFTEISQSIHHIRSHCLVKPISQMFTAIFILSIIMKFALVVLYVLMIWSTVLLQFYGTFSLMFHVWLKLFWARNMHFSFILISYINSEYL